MKSVFPKSMHTIWVVMQVDFTLISVLPALGLSLCHEQFYSECLILEFPRCSWPSSGLAAMPK